MNKPGLYLHIPFCKQICLYCNFAKVIYHQKFINKYLDNLETEIRLNYQQEPIDTIYVGGGTPSCLSIKELKKLFNIINHNFNLKEIKEYSFECNVEDISLFKLLLFKKNKINRLSIGVQSFDENVLNTLNRNSKVNIKKKIKLAKLFFSNLNIDLIYGLPHQDLKKLNKNITKYLKLKVPHLSIYSLQHEKNTKMFLDNILEIDDDLEFKMYSLIKKRLVKNNYLHYELSNFAKEGYQGRHNLKYWNNEFYYGFGLGSHGYLNYIRYENTKSLTKYLKGEYRYQEQKLTQNEIIENELILGFRKEFGINKRQFKNRYQLDIKQIEVIQNHLRNNNLKENKDFIFIHDDKRYIMNEILVDLIGVDYERKINCYRGD